MAHPSLLLRFRLELSDIDRAKYETLDFRIAQHPSETKQFLLTRVLAYALNFEPGLAFSPGGLSDTDQPCLFEPDPASGGFKLCIEVGSPSTKRLHKDMKAARAVKVYTYRDPQPLLRELAGADVHRIEELEIYSFDPRFLERMGERLAKDNRWTVVHSDGSLTIATGDFSETTEVVRSAALSP